jgi:hypothetical protein
MYTDTTESHIIRERKPGIVVQTYHLTTNGDITRFGSGEFKESIDDTDHEPLYECTHENCTEYYDTIEEAIDHVKKNQNAILDNDAHFSILSEHTVADLIDKCVSEKEAGRNNWEGNIWNDQFRIDLVFYPLEDSENKCEVSISVAIDSGPLDTYRPPEKLLSHGKIGEKLAEDLIGILDTTLQKHDVTAQDLTIQPDQLKYTTMVMGELNPNIFR